MWYDATARMFMKEAKNVADQALAVTVIEQEEGRGGWQL